MIGRVPKEPATKVTTIDQAGAENDWLVELYRDGLTSTAYLTAASPGALKDEQVEYAPQELEAGAAT